MRKTMADGRRLMPVNRKGDEITDERERDRISGWVVVPEDRPVRRLMIERVTESLAAEIDRLSRMEPSPSLPC